MKLEIETEFNEWSDSSLEMLISKLKGVKSVKRYRDDEPRKLSCEEFIRKNTYSIGDILLFKNGTEFLTYVLDKRNLDLLGWESYGTPLAILRPEFDAKDLNIYVEHWSDEFVANVNFKIIARA